MLSQKTRVKNRAPAPIQITAEQLLREAHDRSGGSSAKKQARSQITDPEELREYRMVQRKGFEDAIRMNRVHLGNYVKYAKWEEAQEEFERARSVWERALATDHRSASVWLKYAEMEMRNKFVNHARNVWDRAVTLLPRIDQFWSKYAYMEEMLGNYNIARTVFDRWMKWEPNENAWGAYIRFEERRDDPARARAVFERFVACHPTLEAYLKYARWEDRAQRQAPLARAIYERAVAELADWELPEGQESRLYVAFAKFEERQRELARARAIYGYASTKYPHDAELRSAFVDFEKKHGAVAEIERRVAETRRAEYHDRLEAAPFDYDAWLDLVKLEEETARAILLAEAANGDDSADRPDRWDAVREAYERGVAQAPRNRTEKRAWRRYVYLWINYAVFEELTARDVGRSRAVYRACLDLVPHRHFTFAKLWLLAAELEVRARDLGAARRLLGEALGRCAHLAKPKLYLGYMELERSLGEVDRCRAILAKFVAAAPSKVRAWTAFADFEAGLGERRRARAVYDLAVDQPVLDAPETVWKAYIDWEMRLEEAAQSRKQKASAGQDDDGMVDEDLEDVEDDDEADPAPAEGRVARLYERLLDRTKHVKAWLSYARYRLERSQRDGPSAGDEAWRGVFRRAHEYLKSQDAPKDDRVVLLEAWARAEADAVDARGPDDAEAAKRLDEVRAMMPRKIKKRRPRADDETAFEEYYDYVFPDDQKAPINLKLLDMARKWKAGQLDVGGVAGNDR